MATQHQPMAIPEPMNASPHHSKVKLSITLADRQFVAGGYVAGKLEMECRADKGLGIGVIMVELFANQELTSRDHSATSTFIHSKRLFQGPSLPPSNAVQAHPLPGDPPLPPNYYQARRGLSTFLFRIPIPEGSPSSISFGAGLAKVRYELRASVGVVWKNERRLVVDKSPLEVLSAYPYEELVGAKEPEGVIVGENGKFWVHGRLVGSVVVAGETACVELHVKNHSNKKNTGLSLTLNRTLILPGGTSSLELTDTLTHVPFRGPDYIVPPGVEGVANLVFDVPKHSRGVRGGTLEGDEVDPPRHTESLFEIRCTVDIKMTMGFGNKDLLLSVPVSIVHPKVVPMQSPVSPHPQAPLPIVTPYPYQPHQQQYHAAYPLVSQSPAPPVPFAAIDHQANQVWLPPMSPVPFYNGHPHPQYSQHHMAVPPYLVRPSSAGGNIGAPDPYVLPMVHAQGPRPLQNVTGLPPPSTHHGAQMPVIESYSAPGISASPGATGTTIAPGGAAPDREAAVEAEEGKGQRALRVSHHLRMSSRTRSVSPQSHRFPAPSLQIASPASSAKVAAAAGAGTKRGLPPMPVSPAGSASAAGAIRAPLSPTGAVPLSPSLSLGGAGAGGVVHSPRPQLTPKTSMSFNAEGGAQRPKSQRVEDLEKMVSDLADGTGVIFQEDRDEKQPLVQKDDGRPAGEVAVDVGELNKTLPAPPVPTRNKPLQQSMTPQASGGPEGGAQRRPRLETLFPLTDDASAPAAAAETGIATPLPLARLQEQADQRAPPTPTLNAVLPTRYPRAKLGGFLGVENGIGNSESGLDALERKLLAQVGTRKFDEFNGNDQRMGGDAKGRLDDRLFSASYESRGDGDEDGAAVKPIDIPTKVQSPDALNDESAISSLTLGNHIEENEARGAAGVEESGPGSGGLLATLNERYGGSGGGNDSDMEAKTHRGGSVSGDEQERKSWNPPNFPLLMEDETKWSAKASGTRSRHRKGEDGTAGDATAARGSTPTKLSDGSRKSGKSKETKVKDKRAGNGSRKKEKERGEKAERAKTKTDAKGRVAAWLGGVVQEQPPEEEIIPPSPSVTRHPPELPFLTTVLKEEAEKSEQPEAGERSKTPNAVELERIHEEKDVSTAPNPRSSGFLPVGTHRKETVKGFHAARDGTVVEESRKITDLWASEVPQTSDPVVANLKEDKAPRAPFVVPVRPTPQSIRTDRRVSPPSRGGIEADLDATRVKTPQPNLTRNPPPLSDSRNVWQLPEPPELSVKSKQPPLVPVKPATAARLFSPGKNTSDPEVKYDVRSARGGRGGKVASVTAMWASVASGISHSQSQDSMTSASKQNPKVSNMPRKIGNNGRFAPPNANASTNQPTERVGSHLPGKIALPGLASAHSGAGRKNAAGDPPVRTGRDVTIKPTIPPKPSANASGAAVSKAPPAFVPKKLPSAAPVAAAHLPIPVGWATSSGGKSTDGANNHNSSPAPGLFVGDLKSRTSGKSTPNTNLSTPSSGGPGEAQAKGHVARNAGVGNNGRGQTPRVAGGGNIRSGNPIVAPRPTTATKPVVVKSTSVPAVISSSHAIPVLSTTASLARPAGSGSTPRPAPIKVNVGGSRDTPRPRVNSAVLDERGVNGTPAVLPRVVMDNLPSSAISPTSRAGATSPAKSPPPELAFGQARLRDLIRKYQTQAS